MGNEGACKAESAMDLIIAFQGKQLEELRNIKSKFESTVVRMGGQFMDNPEVKPGLTADKPLSFLDKFDALRRGIDQELEELTRLTTRLNEIV